MTTAEFISNLLAPVTALLNYLTKWRPSFPTSREKLAGVSLSETAWYPVEVAPNGALRFERNKFARGIAELLVDSNEKAAADLIYFGIGHEEELELSPDEARLYAKFKRKYRRIVRIVRESDERRSLLAQCQTIAQGFGETFAGLPIEVVLHDTRDPLKSIIAIYNNEVTQRKLGDPNTNHGLGLIRLHPQCGSAFKAGYRLDGPEGRQLKATTIPVDHPIFGLIAFICINIDINALIPTSKQEMRAILHKLVETRSGVVDEQIPMHRSRSSHLRGDESVMGFAHTGSAAVA